jgi:hypothetical protein
MPRTTLALPLAMNILVPGLVGVGLTPTAPVLAARAVARAGDDCRAIQKLFPSNGQAMRATHNSFSIIGDSWGFLYYGKFRDNMIEAGFGWQHEFFMRAVPGTEASQWANGEQFPCLSLFSLIESVIKDDTGTPSVLVSLGGNDLVNDYDQWGSTIFDRIEADLRTLVDWLILERPDIRIYFAGYDILHLEKTQMCVDYATSEFGSAVPGEVNPLLLELGARQSLIADDYPEVTYFHVAGALQGQPGNPDVDSWSPLRYFVLYPLWQQDCIHMSLRGYDVYTGAIVDALVNAGDARPPSGGQAGEAGQPRSP